MNKIEATKFLALIKVAYPSSYKNIDDDLARATVNMWQNTFKDVPYAIMEMAFERFRKVSTFAPTVADMYEQLKALYYVAVGDAMTSDNEDILKLSKYVMEQTSRFREGPGGCYEINYNSLAKLVSGKSGLLLEGGQADGS